MKRALGVAVSGAAIVVAGLVGCSGDKSADESASSATETVGSGASSATETVESGASSATSAITSATDAVKGNPPPGAATVSIDGQEQNIEGQAACTNLGGNIQIAIGNATQGVGAQVTDADPPVVRQVGLGNVNGVAMGFAEGAPGGEASAEKDGNTYKISGTATGVDMANPLQPVTKPFELAVTCP
ncbi:lipoprotein LpqH [Mycolicibacterium mengxianglii]|uniref:lipoprotein LpqH n=1 Tax=Mycolicibacterium mengxianglii TaxID=2736649 RepID=UPI0018D0A0D1|nr:lipoprotein LpqH [Mycolicibacterium mengxianglii]